MPVFFKTPAAFRRWLAAHHDTETELWVGYYRKDTGKASITWPESVDEALCYGWIDGIRKRVDDESYMNRFTPRRPRSMWSAINARRARALIAEGRMQPAGLKAFEARLQDRSGLYSFRTRPESLPAELVRAFRRNRAAWAFYQSQPASYRRAANAWVLGAKRDETRQKRFHSLVDHSAAGEHIPQFLRPVKVKPGR